MIYSCAFNDIAAIDAAHYAVVSVEAPEAQRQEAARFAMWAVGTDYSYASVVGDALNDLTGLHLTVGVSGRMVCSALACRAHERLGLIPDLEPSSAQPADMARYYGVAVRT